MSVIQGQPGEPAQPDYPPPILEVLHGLLAAGWRRRYLIVMPVLLLPVLGGVIGKIAPRSYEARMTILIQEPGRLNPFLEDLAVKTNLKDRMAALSSLLTSRYVLQPVAVDSGMLSADAPQTEVDRVVADLSTAVSVQLTGSELVELKYRSRQRADIDQILLRVGQRFMERVEAPEKSSMIDSVDFLGKELTEATERLQAAETALAEFRGKNAQSLPDLRTTNIQRLGQLRDVLAERLTQLAGAESEFGSVRARLAQTDPVIGRLEQDIVATRGELAVLSSKYTEAHSKVQAAERRLERLEDERSQLLRANEGAAPIDMDRLWNLAAAARKETDGPQPLLVSQVAALEAARTKVEQLRSETANLKTAIDELAARVDASGEIERDLQVREREVAITQDLVQTLRKRFDMAKVTGELSRFQAPERIKVIDRPVMPTAPTRALVPLFAIGGLFGGLFMGIGLAAFLEMSDTSVRRVRQMERLTGVPVLARIMPLPSIGPVHRGAISRGAARA